MSRYVMRFGGRPGDTGWCIADRLSNEVVAEHWPALPQPHSSENGQRFLALLNAADAAGIKNPERLPELIELCNAILLRLDLEAEEAEAFCNAANRQPLQELLNSLMSEPATVAGH